MAESKDYSSRLVLPDTNIAIGYNKQGTFFFGSSSPWGGGPDARLSRDNAVAMARHILQHDPCAAAIATEIGDVSSVLLHEELIKVREQLTIAVSHNKEISEQLDRKDRILADRANKIDKLEATVTEDHEKIMALTAQIENAEKAPQIDEVSMAELESLRDRLIPVDAQPMLEGADADSETW